MVTCPWCGTTYTTFQPNCQNCGGPLPEPSQAAAAVAEDSLPVPPPAPRPVPDRYAWRLMTSDGWAIAAFVFAILGAVFFLTGAGLTLGIITAFIGIPFALLGLVFLGAAFGVGRWRYLEAKAVVRVLQIGQIAEGRILHVDENYNVRVNGRNPWTIHYAFEADGRTIEGQVNTLNTPGPTLQQGKRACILYLPTMPERNSLYPHP